MQPLHHDEDQFLIREGVQLLVYGVEITSEEIIPHWNVLAAIDRSLFRESKMPIAVGIVAVVVLLATLKIASMMVAALTGALLMVLTGCLDPSEVYDAVQWNIIFLIAGVIPLGLALENTGAAVLIAEMLAESAIVLPPIAVLGLFYVVTAILTNIISNQASVVLMAPVASRRRYESARNQSRSSS